MDTLDELRCGKAQGSRAQDKQLLHLNCPVRKCLMAFVMDFCGLQSAGPVLVCSPGKYLYRTASREHAAAASAQGSKALLAERRA